ncbi:MAG: glycosyltransferase [Roseiflexaceae bacterium]|nr:glycosyltransferase [Roseiflexaceae bacterium]
MHILQIYKDYYPVLGGIENHIRDLSMALAQRGHRVTVLVTSLDRKTQVEHPHPGVSVLKVARLLHAASTPISPAMLAYARALRPELVHLHFPFPPGDLVAQAVPGRPPLVVTYHSDIVRQRGLLRLYRPLQAYTLRRATRIIATSPAYVASSEVLRQYAAKCAIVPLGIDIARFTAAPRRPTPDTKSPPTILFVGRLRYYKGLHVLLDAMPQIAARLLIAGTGPEQERLLAQAAQLGLSSRVEFLGDVADAELPALYRRADVFVLPAQLRAEALGLSQIEAMASGVPCVCTELGTGTSYANQHGVTGLVVPPGDTGALAAAINLLLADPALRLRYGTAARERATALFSRDRMVGAIEQVYAEALGHGLAARSPRSQ